MLILRKPKTAIFMLVALMFIVATTMGCSLNKEKVTENNVTTEKVTENDATTENLTTNEEQSIKDTTPATVKIAEVTNEQLKQYADYDEFNAATDSYNIKLLLTTDKTLKNVKLYNLIWNDAAQGLVKDENGAKYQQTELTANKPLVILASFPGTMPTVGIEFNDTDGTAKSYHITMSGEDGSILLTKATTDTEKVTTNDAATEKATTDEATSIKDITPATVKIAEVTEEQLKQYADYNEFNAATDSYGIRLLLTTDKTIRDIKLYSLTWDGVTQGLIKDEDGAKYQQTELTADKPLVIWVSFPGTMPTVGIEFIDADGTTKSYSFTMSGEDGSIMLT